MPLRCVCDTDLTSGRVCTPADRGSPPLGSGARPGRLGPKVTKCRPPPEFLGARDLVLGPGAGARSRWGQGTTGAGGGPALRAFSPRPAAAGRRRRAAGHLVSFSAETRGSVERAPGPAEGPGPGGRGGAGSGGWAGPGRGRGARATLTGTDRFGPDAGGGAPLWAPGSRPGPDTRFLFRAPGRRDGKVSAAPRESRDRVGPGGGGRQPQLRPGRAGRTRARSGSGTSSGKMKKPDGKIVVLGDMNVGKTSLLQRYMERRFPDTVSTVGGAFYLKQWRSFNISIWDTAGEGRRRPGPHCPGAPRGRGWAGAPRGQFSRGRGLPGSSGAVYSSARCRRRRAPSAAVPWGLVPPGRASCPATTLVRQGPQLSDQPSGHSVLPSSVPLCPPVLSWLGERSATPWVLATVQVMFEKHSRLLREIPLGT